MRLFIKTYQNFFSKSNANIKRYLWILLIASVTVSAYNILLSIYLKEVGFTESQVGSVLSLRTFGIAAGAIPVAIIASRISKRKTMMLGLILMFGCGLVQINTSYLIFLNIASFLFGIGHATLMVLQAPIIYDNTEEDLRVTAFSVAFVLQNLAMVISSFVLGNLSTILAGYFASRTAYLIVLNASTLTLLVPCILTFRFSASNMCEGSRTLGFKTHIYDTGMAFKYLLKGRTLQYLLQVAVVSFGAGLIVPFFSIYLKYSLSINDATVGTIMALSQFGTIIGGLLVPFLSNRFGRTRTVLVCQLLSVPFLISISLPQGITVIAISFFFRSSLMNMANPIIRSLAMEIVSDETRTHMSSVVSLSNNLFRSLGIFVGGIMMYRISYNAPYYVTIVCYLIGTYILYKVFARGYSVKEVHDH